MRFGGGVDHQRSRQALQAAAADIDTELVQRTVARRGERGQRGHRATADQDAAAVRGQAEQLQQPADDAHLEVDRCLIAGEHVRVQRAGQQFGDDARGCGWRDDPAEETGVPVPGGMGQYKFGDCGQQPVHRRRIQGKRLIEQCPPLVRPHRAEDRPGRQPRQMVRREVHGRVRMPAELLRGEVTGPGYGLHLAGSGPVSVDHFRAIPYTTSQARYATERSRSRVSTSARTAARSSRSSASVVAR